MKITFFPATVLFCMLLSCGKGDVRPLNSPVKTEPAPAPTNVNPKDGDYSGKGKVTKINNEIGSVELDHEDIPGLMPKMIMEFYVTDKALLKNIAVGDNAEFVIQYKQGSEKIISIKKLP